MKDLDNYTLDDETKMYFEYIKENPANAFKEVPLFTIVGIVYGILMILFPILSTWLPSLL